MVKVGGVFDDARSECSITPETTARHRKSSQSTRNMVQKAEILLKCFAAIGPFILLSCCGLLAGANFLIFYEYGFGAAKNQVYIWTTCFASSGSTPAECVPVNDKRMCSEMTSKLNAVGIMTGIAGFNLLLTVVSIIADLQGCKIPVKNLTRLFFAWSIVPTLLAIAVAVMGMVNAQCGAPQSLEDQEGSYGPGFQMLASSFFGQFLGLLIHTCAMHFIGSSSGGAEVDDIDVDDDWDEEAELAKIKAELTAKARGKAVPAAKPGSKPGAKPAAKRPAAKRPASAPPKRAGQFLD